MDNKKLLFDLIESKSPGSIPLYLVIRGSHAYGTNLPTSDIDYSGIFVQNIDSIFGMSYVEQINDDKNDIVIYEIKRFLELLSKNNPTILELLNTPEDCIIYKDPIFDIILENRDKFLTKICSSSFGGYALTQIRKARGQDKKQNWEKDKVTRKGLLDFIYVIDGNKSILWKDWKYRINLERQNKGKGEYNELFCGVSSIPNVKDIYSVYFDEISNMCFNENIPLRVRESAKMLRIENNMPLGFGYKGIVKTSEDDKSESNSLRLSSIPKDEIPICNIYYNKDAYTQHCKDYNSYQEWLEKRNIQRWVDVKNHDQKIDGKNMMHCKRLIDMSREIAEGKGILVRRDNADELIKIRKGEYDLKSIIDSVENDIIKINEIYKNSSLPDSVDLKIIDDILVKIRKKIYNI